MANIRKFEDPVAFQLRLERANNNKVIAIAARKNASKNDLLNLVIDENIDRYDNDTKI